MVATTAPYGRVGRVGPYKVPEHLLGVGRRVGVRKRRGGALAVRNARPRVAVILEPGRVPDGVLTDALRKRARPRSIRPDTVRAPIIRGAGSGTLEGARAGGALPLITNSDAFMYCSGSRSCDRSRGLTTIWPTPGPRSDSR